MSILYITSWNDSIYHSSGKGFLSSFASAGLSDDLLITYNGPLLKEYKSKYIVDLNKNKWLADWSKKFQMYIPARYGGVHRPKLNHNLQKFPYQLHKDALFFRDQCKRWMYKVAALREAMVYEYDYFIYCDADIIFKKPITSQEIKDKFGDADVIYHQGSHRIARCQGIESGYIIFNMNLGGRIFLEKLFELYESGEFLNFLRWDDGFVLWETKNKMPQLKYKDIVKPHELKVGGHVVCNGEMADYVEHMKGRHIKEGIV